MNNFKNGTLIAVIATVITAILILVTGREDSNSTKVDQEVAVNDQQLLNEVEVVFTIMPSSSDGIQGENPNKVVTTKNDKFGTQTISAEKRRF